MYLGTCALGTSKAMIRGFAGFAKTEVKVHSGTWRYIQGLRDMILWVPVQMDAVRSAEDLGSRVWGVCGCDKI